MAREAWTRNRRYTSLDTNRRTKLERTEKVNIAHYVKMHKLHEANRTSTDERNAYWFEYTRSLKFGFVNNTESN